jgi:hypothetical protein
VNQDDGVRGGWVGGVVGGHADLLSLPPHFGLP